MTKFDRDYFKEKFPNLCDEIEESSNSISVDAIRTDLDAGNRAADPKRSSGPTVVDYIKRCETEDEAIRVIGRMAEHGKIKEKYARMLRSQLVKEGLDSFSSKKDLENHSFTE